MSTLAEGARHIDPNVAWIAICEECGNKAEVSIASNGRKMCEDCRIGPKPRQEEPVAELVGTKTKWATISSDGEANIYNSEREKYVGVIRTASSKVINNIIKRLVRERVFHVEFDRIIQNERWFSVMDLRRIALDVNPNLEVAETKPVKRRRRKKKQLAQSEL